MIARELLVGDVIRSSARRTPNRIAASLGEQSVTFGEVDAAADHLASVLRARGVDRGSRVAWWGETSLEVIPLYFSLAHLGGTFVPLNPRYTKDEAIAILDRAEPAIVITDEAHDGDVTLDALFAEPRSSLDLPTPHEDDPHVIFFTSGTTGLPKGVVLSQRTQRLRGNAGHWPVGPTVCMFPQFHMAGWASTLSTWLSGDEMAYVTRPDADNLLEVIHRRRPHTMYAIPAVWRRILDADRSGYDVSSLRRADSGTSLTTPELLAELAEAFPLAQTSIAYGSTEASGVCFLWPEDVARKPYSVGLPAAGVDVRLDDDAQLMARSPYLCSGYFRDPEATAAAFVDGWYLTGEVAEVDDEGYFYIRGRVKDLIRTGGETVAPVEVDQVVQSHPAVADGAVAGVPHADWGEVVVAFVVLRPGRNLDLDELRRHCGNHLASHKHPREIVIVESIPRTGATGQVQRRTLTDLFQNQHGSSQGS
jgi:acyl-CoA synthetase (AMP-forming)/AMP-acid ligase II